MKIKHIFYSTYLKTNVFKIIQKWAFLTKKQVLGSTCFPLKIRLIRII